MLNDGDYFDFLSKDAYFDGDYKVVRKADRVINKVGNSLNVPKPENHYAEYKANIFAAEVCRSNAI